MAFAFLLFFFSLFPPEEGEALTLAPARTPLTLRAKLEHVFKIRQATRLNFWDE